MYIVNSANRILGTYWSLDSPNEVVVFTEDAKTLVTFCVLDILVDVFAERSLTRVYRECLAPYALVDVTNEQAFSIELGCLC